MKSYDTYHLEINQENHCKVYYRKNDEEKIQNSNYFLITELIFFISSYIFMFTGGWYIIKNSLKFLFCISNKKRINCFCEFLICLITFIFFIPSIVVLLLLFPYFPVLIMIFGFGL